MNASKILLKQRVMHLVVDTSLMENLKCAKDLLTVKLHVKPEALGSHGLLVDFSTMVSITQKNFAILGAVILLLFLGVPK
jgi:hypothetical protein